MSTLASHLRLCVIRPVLVDMGLWSTSAENLLLGTAAHESHLGTYLDQGDPSIDGPAYGIYQMEQATHDDCWDNFINGRADKHKVRQWVNEHGNMKWAKQMQGNLYYSTAMARMQYLRVKDPLPRYDDVPGLANYWHQHWCKGCAGTVQQFVDDYRRYVS